MIRQLTGDCRVLLPTLEPGGIQSCITSPAYYGLRDYGTPPLVWGGDPEHVHEWRTADSVRRIYTEAATIHGDKSIVNGKLQTAQMGRAGALPGDFCLCGAWLGSLGLEPTPELYVEHIVECFRHVRRVLRGDGTLWLNLGDSYNNRAVSRPSSHQAGLGFHNENIDTPWREHSGNGQARMSINSGGLKEKDLLMIPFRVAMALQADGWWLRSVIPWLKRNSMPESVTDRPSTSVEYVFLLSKSKRYLYDADLIREPLESRVQRYSGTGRRKNYEPNYAAGGNGLRDHRRYDGVPQGHPKGRNRRNADWFVETWQGLLLDEQDDPLAFVVNPVPFKESHFAVFPPGLVEPMVKVSTRPGDTILDLFSGAGTVGLAADRLDRNAILCELKADYSVMAINRITGDAPLFAEVQAATEAAS